MGKSLLSISSSSLKFHIPLDTSTKLEVTNFGKYSVQEAEMSEALLTLLLKLLWAHQNVFTD